MKCTEYAYAVCGLFETGVLTVQVTVQKRKDSVCDSVPNKETATNNK